MPRTPCCTLSSLYSHWEDTFSVLPLRRPSPLSKTTGSGPTQGAMAPASPFPTSDWSRHWQQHLPKPIPTPSWTFSISCLWLHMLVHISPTLLAFFPKEEHSSFLLSTNPPSCHLSSPSSPRPLQKCSCFCSHVLTLLEMQGINPCATYCLGTL